MRSATVGVTRRRPFNICESNDCATPICAATAFCPPACLIHCLNLSIVTCCHTFDPIVVSPSVTKQAPGGAYNEML